MAAMVILSGVAFGGEAGFLVGAVTMLASNMLFGQGPWTPWQMFAMGLLGLTAGVLYRKGVLRRGRLSLSVFGALVTLFLYGGVMNPASVLMYQPNPTWPVPLVPGSAHAGKAGPGEGEIRSSGMKKKPVAKWKPCISRPVSAKSQCLPRADT